MTGSTIPGDTPETRQEPATVEHEIIAQPNDPAPTGRRLLRRSKQDRIIGGVCGGLARYVDADPVLFRIAFLALLIPGGLGLLLYIVGWIAMPEFKTEVEENFDSARKPLNSATAASVVGGLLILIGALILFERFVDWFDPRVVGGVVLIAIGALIVMRGIRSEGRT